MAEPPQALLGATIRDYRKQAGISQEALAERSGLHRTYIGGIERGERNVSLENIVCIARALKVPPSRLLERIK
jgi:transcriptional regulator with XRE-family HTH domain